MACVGWGGVDVFRGVSCVCVVRCGGRGVGGGEGCVGVCWGVGGCGGCVGVGGVLGGWVGAWGVHSDEHAPLVARQLTTRWTLWFDPHYLPTLTSQAGTQRHILGNRVG